MIKITKPTLSNLEKIKAAWNMGWSAILDWGAISGHVVGITANGGIMVHSKDRDEVQIESDGSFKRVEICCYLYAGELAGNIIPEGQRFRVKGTREILTLRYIPEKWESPSSLPLSVGELDGYEFFDKSELEPIFD